MRNKYPDFIIVGAARSGTTSLYQYLIAHPQVLGAKGRKGKEVHFFDIEYKKGSQWYANQFPTKKEGEISGEKSPFYFVVPEVPKRIYSLLPKVKIIIILRNPIDRAYSHYHHNLRYGYENLSFEKAIEIEDQRINKSFEEFRLHSYLKRGFYAEHLKRWLEIFPREQLKIVCAESLFSFTRGTYLEITKFLGIKPIIPRIVKEHKPMRKGNYPPMNPEIRKKLRIYFEEPNKELFDLLNQGFGWN